MYIRYNATIIHASLILESEQLLGHISPDDDEIYDDLNDSFSPWLKSFPSSDPLSLINISGDEDLQTRIRKLCFDFRVPGLIPLSSCFVAFINSLDCPLGLNELLPTFNNLCQLLY